MSICSPSSCCILLVEDDVGMRAVVGEILRSEGYLVICAADGAAALEHLYRGLRPSVILLDLMMPGMNGWDFMEIRRRDPALSSIPVVVMSGIDKLDTNTALLGATDVLPKPIELDSLLAVVEHYCRPP